MSLAVIVFGLELLEIHHITLVVIGFLVLAQVLIVFVLCELCLRLERLTLRCGQSLPIFPDVLGYFREC